MRRAQRCAEYNGAQPLQKLGSIYRPQTPSRRSRVGHPHHLLRAMNDTTILLSRRLHLRASRMQRGLMEINPTQSCESHAPPRNPIGGAPVGGGDAMLRVVIRHCLSRPIFVLLLGVIVTLGLSFSLVRATSAAAQMSAAADMGMMESHGDCDGCVGQDMSPGHACGLLCPAPAIAILPAVIAIAAEPPAGAIEVDTSIPQGRSFPPDPPPPRLLAPR